MKKQRERKDDHQDHSEFIWICLFPNLYIHINMGGLILRAYSGVVSIHVCLYLSLQSVQITANPPPLLMRLDIKT